MILRQSIGNDIIFDIDKSVSTEGDSGVYVQYAHARAGSLMEKAGKKGDAGGEREKVHEVEKLLYRFPELVERAQTEYAPNLITTYLTELASAFNNFYAHEEVIGDSPEASYRLAVVEAFKTVMKNGLSILGIPSPERI
jgi:arginyl-tRNA synthetase